MVRYSWIGQSEADEAQEWSLHRCGILRRRNLLVRMTNVVMYGRSEDNTGMFTVQDVIHLIQYYYHTSSFEAAAADVEQIRLHTIRGGSTSALPVTLADMNLVDIEKALAVPPPPLLSVHPLRPLYEACRFLIRTHARRLPLIDKDTQTNGEVVISVLTQYRVLKFIAMNVSSRLNAPLTQVSGYHTVPHCWRPGTRDRYLRHIRS